jgi:transcription elongation factor Elf1
MGPVLCRLRGKPDEVGGPGRTCLGSGLGRSFRCSGTVGISGPCKRAMSIDKQNGKVAFVCDVCSARFEVEATDQTTELHESWLAAEKLGWHARQQQGGKFHTACPKCATDDWKLWNW